MRTLKVGYLSLVKGTWINARLEGQRQAALTALAGLDAQIVDCGGLIQNETEAEAVSQAFDDVGVDVVLVHFLTFALGSIVPGIAMRLRKPVLFWSEPEPPMTGGRIAANSFCATNMNAHALWKLRMKYALLYGSAASVLPDLRRRLKVHACLKQLQRVRIGSLGGRVSGFYTSNFNELAMRATFGAEVESITLLELVKAAEGLPPDPLSAERRMLTDGVQCRLPETELQKAEALLAAFTQLSATYRLDAWAVRCWPEFAELYGIGVCHVLGCLTGSGLPAACEGDIYGALAMLVVKALSGSDPFFCDLISFDQEGDTVLFWHCGAAPLSLCKEGCRPELRKHSIIEGGGKKGLAAEFPLKAGSVTVLRIGETRDGNGYRMLCLSGDALDTEQLLHGTPLKVRFELPAMELAERIVDNGFEHHYVLCHGDIRAELRYMARLLDLEWFEW